MSNPSIEYFSISDSQNVFTAVVGAASRRARSPSPLAAAAARRRLRSSPPAVVACRRRRPQPFSPEPSPTARLPNDFVTLTDTCRDRFGT